MFEPVWQRVVRGSYTSSREKIAGFERFQVRDEHYPAVLRSAHASVTLTGKVYRNVSSEDMTRLDLFEGADYERISTVTTQGEQVHLYLFLFPEKISRTAWDPVAFEQEGMAPFLKNYTGF